MVEDTLKCIREAMISLLKDKSYSEIHMKEIAEKANVGRRTLYRYFDNKELILKYLAESLMNNFAEEIDKQEDYSALTVAYAFYIFVDNNRTEFMILKKARLLSYIEEALPVLMMQVASKTKYKGIKQEEAKNIRKNMSLEDRYSFYYRIAGYWKMAMEWLIDEQPLPPKEMAELTVKIMEGVK